MRFPFSNDSLRAGFRQAEVLSTYLVRYHDNYFRQPIDTLRATQRTGYLVYSNKVLICQLSPPTDPALPQSYRLQMPGAGVQFSLNSFKTQYEPPAECLTTVKQISAVLNGTRIDVLPKYTLAR